MAPVKLKLACLRYKHTRALIDGEVKIEGADTSVRGWSERDHQRWCAVGGPVILTAAETFTGFVDVFGAL